MKAKTSPWLKWGLIVVLGLLYVLSLGWYLYQNIQVGDSEPWQLITSGILLSIPLLLFYACIWVLVIASWQKAQGQIEPGLAKLIYWAPRVSGILIILFVSMFALDMFDGDASLGEKLLGFLMHLLPSIVMIVVLVLAWRWEWVGFVVFLAVSLYFFRFVFGQGLGNFLLFSGPMLLIALLFGVNWWWKQYLQPSTASATDR